MACIYKSRSVQRMEGKKNMKKKAGITLKPGDKIKVTTVLGTESIFLYLGCRHYTGCWREKKSYFTYLLHSSKSITVHRTKEWKDGETLTDYYKNLEVVKQNDMQYEASVRMAKKRLERALKAYE